MIPSASKATQSRSEELIALEKQFGANNYKPLDVVLTRGEGAWVWDVEGRKYLDCLAAYSAVNQGHCHPRLVRAMVEQAQRLALTSRAFRNDKLGPFYELLCGLTHSRKALPMNSGAEAVETAIKAVRKWGYTRKGIPEDKAEIVACTDNFHGRTVTIVSFSTEQDYRRNFGPFTPGFAVARYGDLNSLRQAITPNTVGVMVEPIQGEAGIIIPPEGYLRGVRALCDEYGVAMICDEIQTGLGRTGRMLAEDHENVRADIVVIGKALSGGMYPVSAVLARGEMLDVFQPGEHGSTYGGNPLACAVATEALRVLVDERLAENAARLGPIALERIRALRSPHIKEVRGRGLMIGIELHDNAGGARRFCERLKDIGVLCKETHGTIIRIAPPLIITEAELDWMLERLAQVFA